MEIRAYYMPDNKKWADARCPLLHGGFSALPPAMVLTAQFDVLRDGELRGRSKGRCSGDGGAPA